VVGGLVGQLLARLALPAIRQLDVSPALALFMANLHLDTGVLLWSAGAALLSGMLAGILPSWFGRGTELADALRSSSRSASLSRAALRWQKAMVFGQAMLSVIIVSAAVLIAMSLRNLLHVPDGFDPGSRVVARVQLPDAEYASLDKRRAFAALLLESLAREDELEQAGFTSTLPVGDVPFGGRFFPEQPDGTASTEPLLFHIRRTSWNYLATMGIPLLQGRSFDMHDDTAHTRVAIVSQAAAQRLWPNESALGKWLFRVQAGQPPVRTEVIGVAGNVMDGGYNAPAGEAVYLPYAQVPVTRLSIVVQPRADREAAVTAVRRALRAADPMLAANAVAPLAALVRQANALPRLQTILLLTFAMVAICIVALGSYGLMSQLVASREREFALRLLFGAGRPSLGTAVLFQLTWLTVPGIVLGVAGVWLLSGVLTPFVFGVPARSLLVTVVASTAVLVLASAAALPPAWRAMRVDIRKGIA
jgi:predicted permease